MICDLNLANDLPWELSFSRRLCNNGESALPLERYSNLDRTSSKIFIFGDLNLPSTFPLRDVNYESKLVNLSYLEVEG